MLADLRFVLGAILAVTLLAVMGLGVVTSLALMHEARVRPIEDSRSLAYAGASGRNEFYEPDGAWRVSRDTAPATQLETPAAVAPAETPQQTASIPAGPSAAEAPLTTDAKEPATETLATAPSSTPPPAEDAKPPDTPTAPEPERLASAPATLPGADPPPPSSPPASAERSEESLVVQPAAIASADLPPTPRARPKPPLRRRIARVNFRRPQPAAAESPPSSTYNWAPWPLFGEQPGATAPKKPGQASGAASSNRPQ
jgi:hypothetical protein